MKKIFKKARDKSFKSAGFTLIELIIALSIFIILVSIAVGAFIQSIRTQRTALALIAVNDSVNLSIEQMGREIRTGYLFCTATVPAVNPVDFKCNTLSGDASGDHELQFINAAGAYIRYRVNPSTFALEKGAVDLTCNGGVLSSEGFNFCYKPITAENVKVARFIVKLNHSDVDKYPPLITLIMSVTSKEPDVEPLNIFTDMETSISPRCGQSGCPSDI